MFLGLAKLLTKLKSFNECMEEAAVGDETTVNMLVKDIYGGRYGLNRLAILQVSFGKVGGSTLSNHKENDKEKNGDTAATSPPPANADLCRALVVMITHCTNCTFERRHLWMPTCYFHLETFCE